MRIRERTIGRRVRRARIRILAALLENVLSSSGETSPTDQRTVAERLDLPEPGGPAGMRYQPGG